MRPLPKVFPSIAAIALLGAAFLLPRTQEVIRVRSVASSAPVVVAPSVTWPDVSALAARLGAEETMGAIGAELERVHSFVDTSEAQQRAQSTPVVARGSSPSTASAMGGGGGHSDAWWQGVAMCEQGGNNHPYYGYLSFMDGSQGGKPWDEQVAAANELIARYPGAWAQACVDAGYRASPNG